MTDVAALITDMVKAGVSAEIVGRVAAALAEREVVTVQVKDEAAERRRENDRERTAARRQECDGSAWAILRGAVFTRDNFTCAYCGDDASGEPHCDHVVPLSRGGRSELCNLATSCRRCNLSKGNKTLAEWSVR